MGVPLGSLWKGGGAGGTIESEAGAGERGSVEGVGVGARSERAKIPVSVDFLAELPNANPVFTGSSAAPFEGFDVPKLNPPLKGDAVEPGAVPGVGGLVNENPVEGAGAEVISLGAPNEKPVEGAGVVISFGVPSENPPEGTTAGPSVVFFGAPNEKPVEGAGVSVSFGAPNENPADGFTAESFSTGFEPPNENPPDAAPELPTLAPPNENPPVVANVGGATGVVAGTGLTGVVVDGAGLEGSDRSMVVRWAV